MTEGMDALVEELRALSPAKRRRILAQLDPGERRSVQLLLREREEPPPETIAPARSSFIDELSPALKAQVAERLHADSAELTDAGTKALQLALDRLSQPDAPATDAAGAPKPSLLVSIGRNLVRKRQRA